MDKDKAFSCGNCAKHLVVEERGAGLTIECPNCHQPVTVPVTKKLTSDRACLVHWLNDTATVAKRGGNTLITDARNGLQKKRHLVFAEETPLVDEAVAWLNERLESNYEAHAFGEREATKQPNQDLADRLTQLAATLRERWQITDELLGKWQPRTLNVRQKRELQVEEFLKLNPSATRDEYPASEGQLRYLERLGFAPHSDEPLTTKQASDLIDKLKPSEETSTTELIISAGTNYECQTNKTHATARPDPYADLGGYGHFLLVLYKREDRVVSDVLMVDADVNYNTGMRSDAPFVYFRAASFSKAKYADKLPQIEWNRKMKLRREDIIFKDEISDRLGRELMQSLQFTYDIDAYRSEVRRGQAIALDKFGLLAEFNKQAYGSEA